MAKPRFEIGDFARVRATAPEDSQPGERVRVSGIIELKPNEPVPDGCMGLPPGIIYCCDFWDSEGEPWACFVAERDIEPES